MDHIVFSERPFRALKNFLYFLLWIVELFLLTQFLIELLGFNPGAPFTLMAKELAAPFLWPFQNLYPPTRIGPAVVNWSILIAMLIYQLITYVVVSLLSLFWPRERAVYRQDV